MCWNLVSNLGLLLKDNQGRVHAKPSLFLLLIFDRFM
jgi:hypothetical protein